DAERAKERPKADAVACAQQDGERGEIEQRVAGEKDRVVEFGHGHLQRSAPCSRSPDALAMVADSLRPQFDACSGTCPTKQRAPTRPLHAFMRMCLCAQLVAKQYSKPSPPVPFKDACAQPSDALVCGPRDGCDEFHDFAAALSSRPVRSECPIMTLPC